MSDDSASIVQGGWSFGPSDAAATLRRAIDHFASLMNYQLVIQFRGMSLQNFALLENPEDRLKNALEASESFDGLDQGAHGVNVFIYTAQPDATYQRIQSLFAQVESAAGFTAVCRPVANEKFRTIWPANSTSEFSLR